MSPVPIKPTVYVLLITHWGDTEGSHVGLGPAFWTRIDADRYAHSLEGPETHVTIISREVRGEPTMLGAKTGS